jgi:hypothetical protein
VPVFKPTMHQFKDFKLFVSFLLLYHFGSAMNSCDVVLMCEIR